MDDADRAPDERPQGTFLRGSAAWDVIQECDDVAVKQLLARLVTRISHDYFRDTGAWPENDVDLGYVVAAAEKMFHEQAELRAILDGADLRWFPEDTDIWGPPPDGRAP